MSNRNDEGQEYASLRILAGTNRKLKVLSGLVNKSSLAIVETLVDREYTKQVTKAAKEAES